MRDGFHEGEIFEDVELGEESLERVIYEECRFERCRFDHTAFVEGRFSDCTFHRCDLVGVQFVETVLQNVRFEHGRAMGMDLTQVRTLSLQLAMHDVKLDLSNFAGLPLKGTRFDKCSLRDVVFDDCDLRDAHFGGSDLTGASLRQARLARADLRDTRGAVVDVETCRLERTRVDVETALLALRQVGLRCDALEEMFGDPTD